MACFRDHKPITNRQKPSNTIRYNTVCHSGAQGIYVMMGSGNTITANQLLDNAA